MPSATVKYYIREGLLHAGTPLGPRSADYDETHLRRLRVVQALTDAAGLSLAQVKTIVHLIDHPEGNLFKTLGAAVAALPPSVPRADDYPRARAVLDRLGQRYDPDYAAVAQLEHALRAAEDAGLAITGSRIDAYGSALRRLAEYDIEHLPPAENPAAAVEYAVLGTALYEPVLLALWRLAHQHLAAERLAAQRPPDNSPGQTATT